MLTAIAVLAEVGGALAFKAKKPEHIPFLAVLPLILAVSWY